MATNVRSNPPTLDALAKDTHREFERLNRAVARLTALVASSSGGSVSLALDDLTDVDTTGEGAGDVLTFDGSQWEPVAPGAPGAHAASHYAGGGDEVSIAISQLDDGSACSVLGRSANSVGAYGDITLANGEFLGRRTNVVDGYTLQATDIPSHNHATGDLTSGTLVAARFATGPGIITPAMLDNGAARSALGVTGNASAARADIAGGGTAILGQVLSDNGTTVAFRSISAIPGWDTLYEVDFSALATNDFANGTETIDGLNWTVAGRAGANAFGIVNGSGIVWTPNASSAQTWTVAAQAAPYLYLPVSSIPNWQGGYPLIVDLYLSAFTFENGNDAVRVGLWDVAGSPAAGSTTNRARIADRANHGGTQTVRTFDGSTVVQNPDAWNVNAFSIRVAPIADMAVGVGTYASGWPQFSYVHTLATTLSTDEGLSASTTRLAIIVINASDASVTTTATIARMRVRRG